MNIKQISAEYRDHHGSDLLVVDAARASFGKESEWLSAGSINAYPGVICQNVDGREVNLSKADANLIRYLATGFRSNEWKDWKVKLKELVLAGDEEALDKYLREYKRKAQHFAPFAHPHCTIRITLPIFLARQFVKHQVGGCITGDTLIYFERVNAGADGVKKVTMADIFQKWHKKTPHSRHGDEYGWRKVISARPLRVLNTETHDFEIGRISDVIDSGIKQTYKVTLTDGRNVTMTRDHRVFTPEGWLPFGDAVNLAHTKNGTLAFKKGVEIACNGRRIPEASSTYKDYEWLKASKAQYGNLAGISAACGASTHTIRKWLQRYKLQFDPLASLAGVNGSPVWNKGRGGYKLNTFWSDERREQMRKLKSGANSNWWRGGMTPDRVHITKWTVAQAKEVRTRDGGRCLECGTTRWLQSHHVLPVHAAPERARDVSNLATLCQPCHLTLHSGGADAESEFASRFFGQKIEIPKRPVGEQAGLVAHFMEIVAIEDAGEQQVYDISVGHEAHNFVGNGVVLHNCWSEESRRYINDEPDFWFPDVWHTRPEDVKQGSGAPVENQAAVMALAEDNTAEALRTYMALQSMKVAPEEARIVLPLNMMTTVVWTGSLLFWSRVVNQRVDSHAQLAAQELGRKISDIVGSRYPVSWAALTT